MKILNISKLRCKSHAANVRCKILALSLGLSPSINALADNYIIPVGGDAVIGDVSVTTAEYKDTLLDIGYAYDQGYLEMRLANPKVDAWLPGEDKEIVIPSQYVLPDGPREGIVINVPEMRMYYYLSGQMGSMQTVTTYPVSVGRQDWKSPLGLTSVVSKTLNPTWTPPDTIRAEHAAEGDILPAVVAAGPDNPLGLHALRLGRSGYLIHGTNKPFGIGMRVTHGCLRLYPKDIEQLFHAVSVGTAVRLVNQPYKLGWLNNVLYLEAHPHLEEDEIQSDQDASAIMSQIQYFESRMSAEINWKAVKSVMKAANGIPKIVGKRPYPTEEPQLTERPEFITDDNGVDAKISEPQTYLYDNGTGI